MCESRKSSPPAIGSLFHGQSGRWVFPFCLLVALLLSTSVAPAADVQTHLLSARDADRDREIPLKVYLADDQQTPAPVILFSHGLGGSREGSKFLGEGWARAGYVALFLQHPGSDESVWRDAPLGQRFSVLQDAASGQAFLDRIRDVVFVLDQLAVWNPSADHPLRGKLNLERIGMSGHSFGGITTQAMMGKLFPLNREFKDSRLDAFLVLSPSPGTAPPPERAFGKISVPVMCMTGTRDDSPIDPRTTPESRQRVYPAMPPGDKFQLVFEGGTHDIFTDRSLRLGQRLDPRFHPAILKISTMFWDAYLKEDATAKEWLQSPAPWKLLVDGDRWEWK